MSEPIGLEKRYPLATVILVSAACFVVGLLLGVGLIWVLP